MASQQTDLCEAHTWHFFQTHHSCMDLSCLNNFKFSSLFGLNWLMWVSCTVYMHLFKHIHLYVLGFVNIIIKFTWTLWQFFFIFLPGFHVLWAEPEQQQPLKMVWWEEGRCCYSVWCWPMPQSGVGLRWCGVGNKHRLLWYFIYRVHVVPLLGVLYSNTLWHMTCTEWLVWPWQFM